ncbi:MAG: hypothetical protein KJ061_10360 [Vicinamibacteraceae bacterium]|nr:hypothetical protein [Vicinamibacteraceae bacterium]
MRYFVALAIAAIALAPLALRARQPEPVPPRPHVIEAVAWLEGCWAFQRDDSSVEEHWMAPRGDNMVGTSRTVTSGALKAFELIVLRIRDGRLVYQAHPSGQPSTEFVATVAGDTEVVFENLQHDFPQRIGYRRLGADKVLAWIEGPRRGETRRVEFPYSRARCPGPP